MNKIDKKQNYDYITSMNNIRNLRKQKNLSQTELAQLCGVTQKAISHWEQSRNGIELENLNKLSEIFNVPIDEIIGNNPPEAKGFPTLADFNKDLMAHGFSIEQYEALSETEKNALLNTIKTLVESFKNNNK